MWIVTADLHLDDKPQHAYRWGIFDWLAKQQKKYNAGCLILGDLTDQKDNHSAALVNRMVEGLRRLEHPVYVLKGNHDYIDPKNPFFGFLSHIKGIEFVSEPQVIAGCLVGIPHQPNQKAFDEAWNFIFYKGLNPYLVLLHGLFDGAIAETGARLTGLRTSLIEKNYSGLVLAGDIHKPQQAGIVTYVGAPYKIRFNDDYKPRVLLVEGDKLTDLHFPCPEKHSLTINNAHDLLDANLKKGDQVKLIIELKPEEVVDWPAVKHWVINVCNELGVEVFGIKLKLPEVKKKERPTTSATQTPTQILENFCLAEQVNDEIKKTGLALLKDAT